MPLNTTRLTMNVYQADGEPAFNWRYKFQLGRWGTEGNYHYTDDPVYFTVNSSGILTVDLFPSSLTAEGTVYRWWKIPPNTQEPPFISGWLDVPDSDLTIDLAPLLVGTDLPESTQADALAQVLGAVGVVSAMRDQVESDANLAEAAAADALASATAAALYDGPWLDTVAALIADTSLTYAPALPGTVVAGNYVQTRKEGFAYQVAASGASDQHVTTAGGVKLYYESGGMVGESGRRFQFVSGVIRNRNDGLGWQLISDGSHGHVGVSAIDTNTTGVNVVFDFTATKVISFVAGPDERMAQAGMTVGGSVGLTSSGLWIGAPLQFWFDPVTASITAPAWFDPASFGISGSGAVRVVTHPEISSANSAPVLGSGFASTLNCPDYGVSSFTTTTFGLQSFVDLSGFVYFNGSSWVILTDVDTSVHTITAAWEAANGGQLRITHPSSDSDFEVALISSSSAHRAFVNAVTDTSFTVQFFDHATNTQVASAVSTIGVRFSRRRRCRAASLQSGRVTCVRTQARLDPTLLHDGSLPLANIWFVGLFEI